MALIPRRIPAAAIRSATASHFGISPEDIVNRTRREGHVYPRKIALCLARALTGRSYPQIGRDMGTRHWATVIHSVQEIRSLYHDPKVMADLRAICAKLGEEQ